jgi:hypothetical protein
MLKDLILKGDKFTPNVNFNAKNGELLVEGYSIPEDARHFYIDLINWTKSYFETNPQKVVLTFNYIYFNSSSSKYIFELLKIFQNAKENNCDVTIKWCYEEDDEDLYDSGQTYLQLTNLPFEFVAVKP